VNVLMFTAHAEGINTIFRELSPEVETRVIQVDPSSVGSIFRVRKCLERGELVAILADRMEPGDQSRSSAVTLLGSPVELPHAPFLLAHLLRVTAVLVFGLREGPGRYTVYCEELAVETEEPRNRTRTRHDREAQLEQLLTAYAARLEHYCKRYPLQWFNFFDYWRDEESP
jgi:predicted LPLAT superfamily acyltransferase